MDDGELTDPQNEEVFIVLIISSEDRIVHFSSL
jgi:hypothetical protein